MELQVGELVRVRARQYLVESVVSPATPRESTLVRLSCLAAFGKTHSCRQRARSITASGVARRSKYAKVLARSRALLAARLVPLARSEFPRTLLEDDAQGDIIEVLWEHEVDAQRIGKSAWQTIAQRGFDIPRLFSAYLHTLRWNCVTATDATLFQAPYRAGIEVKAYQLEPLRKALLMPRVNMFIADDVGLGKTLEHEIEHEPERVRASYGVKARRIEPVGIVYLWPVAR